MYRAASVKWSVSCATPPAVVALSRAGSDERSVTRGDNRLFEQMQQCQELVVDRKVQ